MCSQKVSLLNTAYLNIQILGKKLKLTKLTRSPLSVAWRESSGHLFHLQFLFAGDANGHDEIKGFVPQTNESKVPWIGTMTLTYQQGTVR